jgi:SET family sugar efflux transporter-like MFS transporter
MSARSQVLSILRLQDFWLMVAAVTVLGVAFSLTHPYLSLFALTEIHMSSWQFGIYVVSSSASGIFASMLLGKISDRGADRKHLIMLCTAAAAVAYIILSQARSFMSMLITAVALISIGSAAYSQMFAFVRAKLQQEYQGDMTLATNAVRMFFSFAWVAGPVLGAYLISFHRFGPLFLTAAVTFLFAAGLVVPIRFRRGPPAAPERTAVLPYLRERHILTSVTGFTFISMAHNLALITFPVYIVETLRGSSMQLGVLFGLAAALEIPLMILAAVIVTRMPSSRLMWIGALLSTVYFGYVSLVDTPWQIYPMQFLSAAVIAIFMGVGISYFQDMLPGVPGVATALHASTHTVGSVVSGVVFAAVAGNFGYRGVFVASALLASVAFVLLFFFGSKTSPRAGT